MKELSSIQNPLIKEILQLKEKSKARKKSQTFIIEGKRELTLAIENGYQIRSLLFCPEISDEIDIYEFNSVQEFIRITNSVYDKIAHRGSTEGLIGIANHKQVNLTDIVFKNDNPLILVAEAPEKPGNIGALLRTADAANVDAVFIANPKTDLYNPNIIRSSVGCVFTNQIAMDSSESIIAYLKEKEVHIYAASLASSKPYHEVDYTKSTAIVVGTESTGLEPVWTSNADQNIIIPMQGKIDSLNVSVSASILIFEAKRQRKFE